MVGWYCTTASPEPRHVEAHRLLTSLGGENLVFMAVDMAGLGAKTLPVRVYETSLDASQGGAPLAVLVEAAFQLESGEAERVAIDHITHVVPAGLGNTANRTWQWRNFGVFLAFFGEFSSMWLVFCRFLIQFCTFPFHLISTFL